MKATFFWNTVTPIRPHCESSCFQSQAGTTQASQSLEHGRQSPYAPVSWPGLCPPCPAFFPPPPPRGLTSARPTGGFSGATPHDSQPPRHTRGLGMAGAMSWGPGGRAPWGEAGTGRPAEYTCQENPQPGHPPTSTKVSVQTQERQLRLCMKAPGELLSLLLTVRTQRPGDRRQSSV